MPSLVWSRYIVQQNNSRYQFKVQGLKNKGSAPLRSCGCGRDGATVIDMVKCNRNVIDCKVHVYNKSNRLKSESNRNVIDWKISQSQTYQIWVNLSIQAFKMLLFYFIQPNSYSPQRWSYNRGSTVACKLMSSSRLFYKFCFNFFKIYCKSYWTPNIRLVKVY